MEKSLLETLNINLKGNNFFKNFIFNLFFKILFLIHFLKILFFLFFLLKWTENCQN